MQLSELSAKASLIGMVKETGVDDEGLSEFYHKYFKFPLYQDANLALYEGFGNRKIGLTTWNPIRLVKGFFAMKNRLAEKKLDGNMVGEGIIQGGVMVFNKQGELTYAQPEEIGSELDMDAIHSAIDNLSRRNDEL